MSIASNRLTVSGNSAAGDGWKGTVSYARTCGLGLFGRLVATGGSAAAIGASNVFFGFASTNAVNGTAAADCRPWQVSGGYADMITSTGGTVRRIFPFGAYTGDFASILRSAEGGGAFYLTRAGGEDWKLAHVSRRLTASPVWPRMHLGASTGLNMSWDDVAALQLSGLWADDYGPCTSRVVGAPAGTRITHEADGHVEATHTIATGEVWDIKFRWTDDNNCWIVRVDQTQTGTTAAMRLYEVSSGTETLRSSGTGTVTLTNGQSQRVLVTFDGQGVQAFISSAGGVDIERINYTTASTNLGATTAKTSLACTDFISWPRLLTGEALAAIDSAYPYGSGALSEVYVDGTLASDSNTYNPATRLGTGGTARGYKTLATALGAVGSGGTIYVRGGTYAEKMEAGICFPIAKSMTLARYASAETPLLTYPAGNPPLASAGNFGPIVKVTGSASVTFDGISFTGTFAEGDCASLDSDITLSLSTTGGVVVQNCTFNGLGHAALKTTAAYSSLTVKQNRFLGGGFTSRDHNVYDPFGGGTYQFNEVTGAYGYGLHFYNELPQPVTVRANVVYKNNEGGIIVSGPGHVVENNTSCFNGSAALTTGYGGVVFWKGSTTGVTFRNNIVRGNNIGNPGGGGGDVTCDDVAVAGSNNDVQSVGTPLTGSYSGTNDTNSDPLFVNASPSSFGDLSLQAGSPCVGAGVLIAGVTLLDPASTTAPAEKAGSTSTTQGAFAPS